jgi:hypothetical protein
MLRLARTVTIALTAAAIIGPILAIEPDRDFSGKWIFDPSGSNTRAISAPPGQFLTIAEDDAGIQCSATRPDGGSLHWTYAFNGADTSNRLGEESQSSKVKWEGSALLINTIASGPQDYSFLDRWTLSRDRNMLIIERQTMRNGTESEGLLRYRREGHTGPAGMSNAQPPARAGAIAPVTVPTPVLQPHPEPAAPPQVTVPAGTRIPLSLRNAIDTKHSHEGDRVYLDTLYPVVVENRIVIPRGSYVSGTLTTVKPAGAVKKGELYIRFD